jgi:hypothetical protein
LPAAAAECTPGDAAKASAAVVITAAGAAAATNAKPVPAFNDEALTAAAAPVAAPVHPHTATAGAVANATTSDVAAAGNAVCYAATQRQVHGAAVTAPDAHLATITEAAADGRPAVGHHSVGVFGQAGRDGGTSLCS